MSLFDYTTALEEVAKLEGIYDAKIQNKDEGEKGDGYVGEMKMFEIIGQNEELHVVLKSAPKSEKLRQQGFVVDAFENEINFYTKVNPIFQKFQDKHDVEDRFDGVAKCYKTSMEEFNEYLILQNLKVDGYSMWNRKVVMNKEHIIAVFKEYAKFHAISYALRDQESDKFQEVLGAVKDIFIEYFDDTEKLKAFNDIINKAALKVKESLGRDDVYNAFINLKNVWFQKFQDAKKKFQDINVILHGDCWCNNFMFKYGDSGSISTKIIDWQILKIATPILDLSHFLYTNGSKEHFDDLDSLLEIYHATLSYQARALGTDIDKILPLNFLKELWQEYGAYGLIMSILTLKVMLSDSDEAPNLSKSAEDNTELISTFYFESRNDDEYQRRFNDIILHCYERKLI